MRGRNSQDREEMTRLTENTKVKHSLIRGF